MKLRGFLILLMLITYNKVLAQEKNEILSDIKNKFELINELIANNALRQFHSEYNCNESSGNGSLVFYYNSSELKKITHNYTKGRVKYTDDYYIWDDQLFFHYSTHKLTYNDYHKNRSGRKLKTKVQITLEERFYFHNEIAVKCQFKDFETRSNLKNNPSSNYVRNQTTSCDDATNVLKKYEALILFQNQNITDSCILPKSIQNIPVDAIYGELGLD